MGYIRRRGNYVSVIPPLFAARLVEELASTQESSIQSLFDALGKAGRGRFLERLITVDLPEKSPFWDFIFDENGPLEYAREGTIHFDHIESLARAVPARTARFLESRLRDPARHEWKGAYCLSTLRELAYEAESCAPAMRCLELFALREVQQTRGVRETKLFCECFVDWYHEFPMSYEERAAWVEGLLTSQDRSRQLLGAAHIVAFVTEPPPTLTGYSGGTARRLGQPPPRRMWKEVFDYMGKFVELRFQLTQSEDQEIAEIARNGLETIISHQMGHVSPDQLVAFMDRMEDWSFSGKLDIDVRKLRTAIHWVEERYRESSQKAGQEEFREKWKAVLTRIANIRERFDGGDFLMRLKIATGGTLGYEYDAEAGEQRLYRYQKKLRELAIEAVNDPGLMTEAAWNVLADSSARHAAEFTQFVGESDHKKEFLPHLESQIGSPAGNWRFGSYCYGLYGSDSPFVENYLSASANKPTFHKAALLSAIRFIGPTIFNRKLLFELIANKSIAPIDLANMFNGGRWLDDIPVTEVVAIMDFIAQGDKWPEPAANVMSLYLHLDKPMPKELIPFADRLLQEIEPTYDNAYDCDKIALGIAKTDLDKGFRLLSAQIVAMNKLQVEEWREIWNPFSRRGGGDFWNYLRAHHPEEAYVCFCALKNRHILRHEIMGEQLTLLDLINHLPILLKIANESESAAERMAEAVSIKQPGFFPFAFQLLSGRPIDGKVAASLRRVFKSA
jgi:hypothetical protein